mmetsp:Transcript_31657/g.36934  ORF Transcript_31657/g.36934 Transcript_31657/m.36934 type:complete len:238 (-) Transcript_31657:263-976(-)
MPPKAVYIIPVALVIILCSAGSYFVVAGKKEGSKLSEVNVSSQFASVESSCTIIGMENTYETIRRRETTSGSNSGRTYDVCVDTVSYSFTVNGDTDGTVYKSRVEVSERNSKNIMFDSGFGGTNNDLCTPNEDEEIRAYEGSYVDEDTPFVCEGICENGAIVACWKSIETGFNEDWANCGNDACYKLIDPAIELSLAVEDSGFKEIVGYFLIGLGCAVVVFSFGAYFCCCRRMTKEV